MVAKSEASMPMSRALAKLAVATDLGTAARPSTSVPAPGGAAAATAISAGGSAGGKSSLSTASGRSVLLKPSATRSVLAALPLPLTGLEYGNKAKATAVEPAAAAAGAAAAKAATPRSGPAAGGAANGQSAVASGVLVTSPSTPRLPPLPTHSSSPPPLQQTAAAASTAAAAAAPGSQLPPTTPPSPAPQWTSHPHPHPHLPASPPLPPCGAGRMASSPGAALEISKELRDAARNHPGLPASLLAQLHHPRRPGPPASAPFAGAPSAAAAAAATSPKSQSGGGAAAVMAASAGSVRPLSPRSRAHMTASIVYGGPAAAFQQLHLAAPPPAAVSALSPEALAVLLAAPSQPPPPPPGGLLVMRRGGPAAAALGTGAALRPSTAHHHQQQSGGGSSATAAGPGSASPGAPPSTAGGPARPPVMPHMTVPYKPGSIRLPPGGVPGITAAVALGGPRKGSAGPGSAAGSGAGSPVVPATATTSAATAAAAATSASELLRPWTSASAGAGGLRPTTANPLTHSMPMDTSSALVVRVPRPAAEAPHAASPLAGGAGPPRQGSSSAGRGGASSSGGKPNAAATAPGTAASAPGGASKGVEERQLTAQELRAVLAALAAARPEAAAMLLQRPATAAGMTAQAGGAGAPGRPGSNAVRRPATSAGVGGPAADASDETFWGSAPLYGNRPPGSARGSSRASTRGSLLSGSAISIGVGVRDPSVYDDKWPRPASGASRPSSRGAAAAASDGAPPSADGSGGGGGGSSRGGSRRPAISAWGATIRPLRSIPEEAELSGGEEALTGAAGGAGGGGGLDGFVDSVVDPLQPLETLDPDPELDSAWVNIVASNQRPDTAAARSQSSGINVFSRPATGSLHITRQAAPMVLVVEDITASTPEVLERELEALSLEELQALQTKLYTRGTT